MRNPSVYQHLFFVIGLLFVALAISTTDKSNQQFWASISIIFGALAFRQVEYKDQGAE